MSETFEYVGDELQLFAAAKNWKQRLRRELRPFVRGDVLEVGAGIGSTTAVLRDLTAGSWTSLEPDRAMAEQLANEGAPGVVAAIHVVCGTIEDLPSTHAFDTIIYIDVLEHIRDDSAEVLRAADRLTPSGRIIAVSPAHQWLFSPFDKAIGHYRRYARRSFAALGAGTLTLERMRYLDSVGLLASAANRFLLRHSLPTIHQVTFWDRYLVPLSRLMDPITGYKVGKSLIAVWQKQMPPPS